MVTYCLVYEPSSNNLLCFCIISFQDKRVQELLGVLRWLQPRSSLRRSLGMFIPQAGLWSTAWRTGWGIWFPLTSEGRPLHLDARATSVAGEDESLAWKIRSLPSWSEENFGIRESRVHWGVVLLRPCRSSCTMESVQNNLWQVTYIWRDCWLPRNTKLWLSEWWTHFHVACGSCYRTPACRALPHTV